MRFFIAIQLSKEAKESLINIQEKFRSRGVRGNYTKEENFHLTLAFIGEYHNPKHVLDAMNTVDFSSFSLHIEQIGSFHKLWWAGLTKNKELERLVKNLRYVLADSGIPFDKKKFTPHITLIRQPEFQTQVSLSDISIEKADMIVNRIFLMQSTKGKNGMIYTEMGSVEAIE